MSAEKSDRTEQTRRTFFSALLKNAGRAVAAGAPAAALTDAAERAAAPAPMSVSIHPHAVSRTNESAKSHGE